MNDLEIEQKLQLKGLNAPRVTPEAIVENIDNIEIVKYISKSGQVLRWAVITMKNGFAVTGKPSASVSPENDDEEIGERIAVANARNEIWPLMGYALKELLYSIKGN